MIFCLYALNILIGAYLSIKYLHYASYAYRTFDLNKKKNLFLFQMCLILGWLFFWTLCVGFAVAIYRHMYGGCGSWRIGATILLGVLPYSLLHLEED